MGKPFTFSTLRVFTPCLSAIPFIHRELSPAEMPTKNHNHHHHLPFQQLRPPYGPQPSSLPGRPGSLTPQQELKLRELWAILFRTFGILDEDQDDDDGSEVTSIKTNSSKFQDIQDDKYGMSKSFRQLLAKVPPGELRTAFWDLVKGDNPDALLLRFLRARKWNVNKAFVMLGSTIYWRISQIDINHVLRLTDDDEKNQQLTNQYKIGKCYIRGRDKEGRPIVIIPVRKHKASSDNCEKAMNQYTIQIIETVRLFLSQDVDQATVIFDMSGFSMANMDYAPLKFMISCFEAHYPESLGICLIHSAPWVFHGVWKLIKGWLDPTVANKIQFTKKTKDLEKYIDKDQLIEEFGGNDKYIYKYIPPKKNENYRLYDNDERILFQSYRNQIVFDLEDETRKYILNQHNHRQELFSQLRKSYVGLDPYVRARCVFDRIYNTNEIDSKLGPLPPTSTSTRKSIFVSSTTTRRQRTETQVDYLEFQQDQNQGGAAPPPILIRARESIESFYSARTSFGVFE